MRLLGRNGISSTNSLAGKGLKESGTCKEHCRDALITVTRAKFYVEGLVLRGSHCTHKCYPFVDNYVSVKEKI